LTLAFPAFILTGLTGISIYTHSYLVGYVTLFNALSGLLNAVFLALLIGRLDSKFIGLPSDLVSILYIYAAVQPLFVVFGLPMFVNEVIKTIVFVTVLLFKIYFFFIIIYAFQTGRLLNYFLCFPELKNRVDSIFKNQFEITIVKEHSHHFFFNISKDDSVVFTSDLYFDKRRECLEVIKHLRKISKNKKSFKIREYDKAYWVEIQNEDFVVYCISQNCKTIGKAVDLQNKAIEQLAYCKLNYT
jgi:hypothetical protein